MLVFFPYPQSVENISLVHCVCNQIAEKNVRAAKFTKQKNDQFPYPQSVQKHFIDPLCVQPNSRKNVRAAQFTNGKNDQCNHSGDVSISIFRSTSWYLETTKQRPTIPFQRPVINTQEGNFISKLPTCDVASNVRASSTMSLHPTPPHPPQPHMWRSIKRACKFNDVITPHPTPPHPPQTHMWRSIQRACKFNDVIIHPTPPSQPHVWLSIKRACKLRRKKPRSAKPRAQWVKRA